MEKNMITKEETGFGGYTNEDGTPYTFLIADGYCRGCDTKHLLEQVELMRYLRHKDGTSFYCHGCGTEHVLSEKDYQENISTFSKLIYTNEVFERMQIDVGWVKNFNEDYAMSKIDIALQVLRNEFVQETKNLYKIKEASRFLWDWEDVMEDRAKYNKDTPDPFKVQERLNKPISEKDKLTK